MSLLPFRGQTPRVAPDAYVAPGAWLIGDVTLGPEASVWFNAVLRADSSPIVLGRRVNLQDAAIVHVDEGYPTHIGDDVTVGHAAIIHAATRFPPPGGFREGWTSRILDMELPYLSKIGRMRWTGVSPLR